jgi:hypothetical protein
MIVLGRFDIAYTTSAMSRFNMLPREGHLKAIKTPMSEGYHAEIDDSPLFTEDDSVEYRSMIGFCIWIVFLGRFDIAYVNYTMNRFNILPREGHLKAVKRILSYLKTFPKGRVIIDTSYPDHSVYAIEDHSNWMEFYPDTGEEIPKDLPPEKDQR